MHTNYRSMKCSNQVPTIVYQSALNGQLQHLHSAVRQATASSDLHSAKLNGTTSVSIGGAPVSSVDRSHLGTGGGLTIGGSSIGSLSIGGSSIGGSSIGGSSINGSTIGISSTRSSIGNTTRSSTNKTVENRKSTANKMTNLLDFYPDAHNDGIYLTWDHAVNSQSLLEQSLSSDSLLIEADVSLLENSKYPIAIMAHPPAATSDLSLDSFLQQIIASKSKKGIKLDFKSTKVVEPSFRCLAKHYANLQDRPLILNADIVAGDYPTANQPVDAWTFLMLSSTRFPKAIISIGWTIQVNEQYLTTGYSRKMVDQMLSVIKQYNIHQTNPLTFAVNASLMKVSMENLEHLLAQSRNSSLTIFAHHTNPLTLDDLIMFRNRFAPNQLYYDVPKQLFERFRSQAIGH